jgi:hypothetical protein
MNLPEISSRAWHLARTARFLRDEIRLLEAALSVSGSPPADLAGLMGHLGRIAKTIENPRAGDSPALDTEAPDPVEGMP